MKKIFKIIIGLLVIGILIQFYPIDRTIKRVPKAYDMLQKERPQDSIAKMIKTSCYDCHSNQTYYPIYAYYAPISWYIQYHVVQGRKAVNFSRWKKYNKQQKEAIIHKIIEKIQNRSMPLHSYLYKHPEAELSEKNREKIMDWFTDLQNRNKSKQ